MRDKLMIIISLFILIMLFSPTAEALSTDSLTLVNRQYALNSGYTPQQLVYLNSYIQTKTPDVRLRVDAAQALGEMVKAMQAAGISDIRATNGYRDYKWQSNLYQKKINYYRSLGYDYIEAQQLASTIVAPPGLSEHQTGLAVDLSTASLNNALDNRFATTAAGNWITANCYKYGFIIRYPEDKTAVTGYVYEPWHIRYVGQPHAELIDKNGLCLEEYLQLLADQEVIVYHSASGVSYAVYHSRGGFYRFAGQIISRSKIDNGYSLITTILPTAQHIYLSPFSLQSFINLTNNHQPVRAQLFFPMFIATNSR